MRVLRSNARLLLILALLGGLAALGGLTHAAAPARARLHLLAPENVPPDARGEVRARMTQHAASMSTLVRAVILLDRPTISRVALRIADEEWLARGRSPELDTLRPLLPKAFFVEQETLRTTARALADAAVQGKPDEALADHFAAVTRTCVRCHGAYLHELPPGVDAR
jgi:hypothetical protein